MESFSTENFAKVATLRRYTMTLIVIGIFLIALLEGYQNERRGICNDGYFYDTRGCHCEGVCSIKHLPFYVMDEIIMIIVAIFMMPITILSWIY